jgi:hypothetical protein
MAISYERRPRIPTGAPQLSTPPPAPGPAVPAAPPAVSAAAPASLTQRGPDGLRVDLAAALAAAHPDVQSHLRGGCWQAVQFLDQHLSPAEPIRHAMSIAPSRQASVNSVLAITDRRLVFVAPLPQAVSLQLTKITKSQFFNGYFFLNGDGREFSLGWDTISEAATDDFSRKLDHASAVAELAGL